MGTVLVADSTMAAQPEPVRLPRHRHGALRTKNELAYAFSLKPRDYRQGGWQLVVISKTKQGAYRDRVLGQTDERVPPYVIYSVPPEEYTDAFETESIRLRLDGIQVEQMEAGSMLFYWKEGFTARSSCPRNR